MSYTRRSAALGTALSIVMLAGMASISSAHAAGYHRRHLRVRLAYPRAHLRPDFIGARGFAGGPPGPYVPMLIDFTFLTPPGQPLLFSY